MQQLDSHSTIVAVSSPILPALRAIIRVSGRLTRDILNQLIRAPTPQQQAAKIRLLDTQLARCEVLPCDLGLDGRTLPIAIYYWPDERSYTGEPCAEFHVLGAVPIVESLMQRIASAGAVPATRGEFTLRSFLAGKLDLTQAEAVLGVIEADSDEQLEQALRQLGGNISTPIRVLRDQLLELIAHLEAGLDFVEEDIEFISAADLITRLESIHSQLCAISMQLISRGTRQRQPRLVLVGLPNAGKSSLFNALLGQSRAIVSSQAGTTRDAVSAILKLNAQTVELIDTAGMEQLPPGTPRALAQQVLEDRLSSADAILLCVDLAEPADPRWIGREVERLRQDTSALLVVGTKQDLAARLREEEPHVADGEPFTDSLSGLEVGSHVASLRASIHDHASVQRVRDALERLLATGSASHRSDAMHRTMVRCGRSLELAIAAIGRAIETAQLGAGEELVAAELRIALDDLAAVMGEVHTEDILGQIFSRFCIGK